MASLPPLRSASATGAVTALQGAVGSGSRRAAIVAHARLARPPETAVVLGASFAGARLAAVDLAPATLLALAASNALLFAASMIYNDWHDLEEDRVNKPQRPIVRGLVPRERALWMSVAAFGAGIAVAIPGGAAFVTAALLVTTASVAYTTRLKGVPFVGNAVVGLVSTFPLACWMLLVTPGPVHVVLALGCFFARLGGEIIKTAEDVAGDATCGLRTVATWLGALRAGGIGLACLSLALLLALVPVWLGVASAVYVSVLSLSALLTVASWLHLARSGTDPHRAAVLAVSAERVVMVLMLIGIGFGVHPQA